MSNDPLGDMKLMPGCEYVPAGEAEQIAQMVADLQKQLNSIYPAGSNALRVVHPKMHGCVKAEFTVLDDLDKDMKAGLFKDAKTFPAYIRFSNNNSKINHDYFKDVRGMAIKVFDVQGEKLHKEPKDAYTQDFLLIDSEAFLSKNVAEFRKVVSSVSAGKMSLLLFLLNPLHFPIVKRLIGTQKRCHHVLDTQFWSTTPYLFGNNRAVKYHVQPASDPKVQGGIVRSDENYLRSNMVRTLNDHDVYFDFFVQFQTDANLMPIEDPTVKWGSPYIKVARIRIPKQDFNTEEQNHMGEDFSFSPWHSLIEHRPLGGLNRARRSVYYAMSEFWHSRNSSYSPEP